MLPRKESPEMVRQRDFHSKSEAKEYVSLFLSDMCFWEQTSDHPETRQALDTSRTNNNQTSSPSSSHSGNSNSNSNTSSDGSDKEQRWKAAVDPVTGRTYYYDTVTRLTQWEKPSEMKHQERQSKKEKRKRERAFFREMEENIMAGLQRGELIPGVPRGSELLSLENGKLETSRELSATRRSQPTNPTSTNTNQSTSSNSSNAKKTKGTHSVRTISGMDERVLASLSMNSPTRGAAEEANAALHDNNNNHKRENRQPKPQLPGRPPLFQRLIMSSSNNNNNNDNNQDPDSSSDESVAASSPTETLTRKVVPNSHYRRHTGGGTLSEQYSSSMTNPNVKATIKCVCGVYRAHVVQHQERSKGGQRSLRNNASHTRDIFRDDYELPRRGKIPMPSMQDICTFYFEYFSKSQMEHDTIIMTLIYVERLIKETNGTVAPTPENWRSFLFSCMILASKVWDDLSMWNVDFSNVSVATGITPFSLGRINELELGVLTSLGFDVRVPASEYARYYFLIRTMLIRSGLLANAAAPLSKEEAKLFENRTSHYQNAWLNKQSVKGRRSRSVDWECFTQSSCPGSPGPVLGDNRCLEQLVSPHQ